MFVSGDILEFYLSFLDFILNKVVFDINVFQTFMKWVVLIILYNSDYHNILWSIMESD
jgi:hypothetical protein